MAAELHPHHCTAAHKAGLTAGIEGVFVQVGDGGPGAELPDQPCLAVEGGVMLRVDLIFIGEDDLAVLYQHRAEELVAMLCGQLGKADGLAHEVSLA